jgi:hypothetical protein
MARFENIRLATKPHWCGEGGAWGKGSATLDAPGEYIAWCFQAQEPDLITHLGVNITSVVGSPVVRLSLRTPDAVGRPGANMITAASFVPTVTGFQWFELGFPFLVSRGQQLFFYTEATTSDASNKVAIWHSLTGASSRRGFPFTQLSFGGGVTNSGSPGIFGYKSTLRSYGSPFQDILFPNVQSPAQIGFRFWLNPGWGKTFRLYGCQYQGRTSDRANRSVEMILYQGDTELHRRTIDGDIPPDYADGLRDAFFADTTMTDLDFGKQYYLAFAPNEPDTNFALRVIEVAATIDMTALTGGTSFYLVERPSDLSTWTVSKTKRPMVDLYVEDWTKA